MGIISGNRGAFPQPGQWGRNESGNFATWVFNGTKREVALLAATFAQLQGLAYQVSESFGMAKLEVYLPWNPNIDPTTDLIVKWEFFAQRIEKDLLSARVENPNTVAALSAAQVQTIRNKLLQPPDGKTTPFPTLTDFEQNGESNGELALQIYTLMQQGVTAFPVEAPSLRRTFVTSNQYATAYALSNVRKIISTASLAQMESIPRNLLFSLPTDVWSDPNPDAGDLTPALAYGWYKRFPTIQQVARLKWSIVQEWEYGLWATLIWGNPL